MPADKLKRRQNNFYFSLSQYDYNADDIEIYLYDMIAYILINKNIADRDDDSDLFLTEKITNHDFEEYIYLDCNELIDVLRVIKDYGISENLYKILAALYVLNEAIIKHDYYSTMRSRYNYEEEIEYVRNYTSKKQAIFDCLVLATKNSNTFKERVEKIVSAIDTNDIDLEYPEDDHPRFF